MAPEAIADILKQKFGDKIVESTLQTAHPHVVVAAEAWHDVARFLRDDSRMQFNMLRCVSSLDLLEDEQLAAIYDLDSLVGTPHRPELYKRQHTISIRVEVPRGNPHVPSVADLWPAADWHEREAYDLMGIVFDDHPDSVDSPEGRHPRRILCPDDWEGHALRKDYVFPMEYQGIPAVTEYGQTRPVH